eukprot:evm.model.scf_1467EXC.2 EVM.evm.TU.scf_1467EXC.2   scf_1467EXC:13010-15730(+)
MIRVYRAPGSRGPVRDVESGNAIPALPQLPQIAVDADGERALAGRLQASNHWVLGLLLLFLFITFHPATLLAALVCVVLFVTLCMRFAARIQQSQQAAREILAGGSVGSPSAQGLWTGGNINSTQLDLLNLQLSLMNRDFNQRDYEMLLGLDEDAAEVTPLSEEDLATIPMHKYRRSSSVPVSPQASRSTDRPRDDGRGAETCSVCLEGIADGDDVRTLPCFHHFHDRCILPWLRQQGVRATCPVCKLAIFRS